MKSQDITLREPNGNDEEFLYSVYASTRREEVAIFGWDPAQEDAFLRMQFTMQTRAYGIQFPDAEYTMILSSGDRTGRLIVDRTDDHLLLVDIAVLPEYRGKGIGTYLIRQLQNEAADAGKPMLLDVEKSNLQARKLYENLGFTVTGETEFQIGMKWSKN